MTLSKELLAAIVAAFAAMIVAVTGLMSALRAAREQRQTQIAVEKLRDEIALSVDKRKKRSDFIKEKIDYLAKDIELIQVIRDDIRRLIDPPKGISRLKESVFVICKSVSNLDKQYQKHYSLDTSDYIKLIHDAKTTASLIESRVKELSKIKTLVSDLDGEDQAYFRYSREHLLSIQEKIKSAQILLINEYLE